MLQKVSEPACLKCACEVDVRWLVRGPFHCLRKWSAVDVKDVSLADLHTCGRAGHAGDMMVIAVKMKSPGD